MSERAASTSKMSIGSPRPLPRRSRRSPRPLFRPRCPAATIRRSSGQARYLSSPSPRCSTSRIARHTSSPMKSASASGPIGCAMPSFITVSIASGVATPSITQKIASLIIGIRTRLATKPGIVVHLDRRLAQRPRRSPSPMRVVASLVAWPRITSTSCITGTGFMKCIPITWSGRRVRAAISVMEIELVLVARIALGRGRPGRAARRRRT